MRRLLGGLVVACVPFAVMAEAEVPIDGATASGDRIRLYSTGRWEYVDAKKAEAARPAIEAYEKERSLEQGGLLGIGRKIKPGDPDYNRGSMGGKSR